MADQHPAPDGTDPDIVAHDPAPEPAATTRDAAELLTELGGLYDLAIRAEELAQVLGMHGGHDLLTGPQLSALEQARDNASAIVASLERAR